MSSTPTDLQILDLIFEHHLPRYLEFSDQGGDHIPQAAGNPATDTRQHKSFVPMDLDFIAAKLKLDRTLLVSRLFDHLDKKYRYEVEKDSYVFLFSPLFGRGTRQDRNVVNFPYLSSVLAGMRDESRKYRFATGMAAISLSISLMSFFISVISRFL